MTSASVEIVYPPSATHFLTPDMNLIFDPPVSVKVNRMEQRVRWKHNEFLKRGIDQTRLVLDRNISSSDAFSFSVIGDSGTGQYRGDNPQRRVAEWLMANNRESKFILHTGDLVYLVGACEQYPENFIVPYREWLVGGKSPRTIPYDQMTFKIPFLPVLGNHDYYDIPFLYGLIARILAPIQRFITNQVDVDYGHQGSHQGDVFARAFLDYLKDCNPTQLAKHIANHYTAKTETGHCLQYRCEDFTRLPNRYYTFRQGDVDFFALDSNTFNAPLPSLNAPNYSAPDNTTQRELMSHRQQLLVHRKQLLNNLPEEEDDTIKEQHAKLEQIDEQVRDVDKQLNNLYAEATVDFGQLNWLKQRLIDSWQNPTVRGRVLYFHHPPYVTEASKWYQGQTLAVRYHLRCVLDAVKTAIGPSCGDRPIVDLVISGHAHCFEYLQTLDTGHADAYTNFLICGGSGFSLRRQRSEGSVLTETINGKVRDVAKSHQFVGRNGHGSEKRRPYSALTIEVLPGTPLRFNVHPHVVEKYDHQWQEYTLPSLCITSEKPITSTSM